MSTKEKIEDVVANWNIIEGETKIEKSPRPICSVENKQIREYVSEKIVDKLVSYYENKNTREQLLQDLNDFLEENPYHTDNGFEMAKEFTNSYCCYGDTELCEIFDNVFYLMHQAHQILVKEWIDKYKITPKFKIGDKIYVYDHRTKSVVDGEIIKIDLDEAKYYVFSKDMGHGINSNGVKTNSSIVCFEDIEKINETQETK